MRKVTAKNINDELLKTTKPTLYTNHPMPLNDLSDRCFEILLYHIFKERLKIKDQEIIMFADNVSLMQGVAEQGRDIILSKDGLNTGVIQCKKYKGNLSITEVAREILKFILYYLHDKSLIGDIKNFNYYLSASTGFSGKAIGAFNDFGKYLCTEPKLKDWVEDIFRDYPAKFSGWSYEHINDELLNVCKTIKIKKIIPQDCEYWISEFTPIQKTFFKVMTVTDNTLVENLINNYLKPIIHKLDINNKFDAPDYTFRFKEYLKTSYEEYSSAKTLVFGNQQKRLEDIYYPLSVAKIENAKDEEEFEVHKIDKYREDFIPTYRKLLIIDNGGMGKSTLLKWLFLSIVKQNAGIPIFIELRKINPKNDILNEITNKLNPLNRVIEKDVTAKILSENNFIIFFDGYDEIKDENREFATSNIQDFVNKCSHSQFVITSRPEKALLTFADFQEFKVKRLEKEEAYELIKKLDNYKQRSQRLIQQIEDQHLRNINEFLSNPLLISLLFKKFEYRETLPFKKQEFFYEVYEALFQAHDLSKGDSFIREKECRLSFTSFFQILRGIAFKCIKDGIEFNETQLLELINASKNEFDEIFDSKLFLNDLIKAVPLFQKDGLIIKWAHKSLQQYFAAEYICRDSKANQEKILLGLYNSQRAEAYDLILELCYEIDYKIFKKTILYKFCSDYIQYHRNNFTKIKSERIVSDDDVKHRSGLLFGSGDNLLYSYKTEAEKNRIIQKFRSKQMFFTSKSGDYLFGVDNNLFFGYTFKFFLLRQKSSLINRTVSPLPSSLPFRVERPFYFDNDDPFHPLNAADKFPLVTKLLESFNIGIKYDEAENLISQVDLDRANEQLLDNEFNF